MLLFIFTHVSDFFRIIYVNFTCNIQPKGTFFYLFKIIKHKSNYLFPIENLFHIFN